MKEQTEKDRQDESRAAAAGWARLKEAAAAGNADAKARLDADSADESAGAHNWWKQLEARANGGDAAAEEEVKKIREAVYMEYHPEG